MRIADKFILSKKRWETKTLGIVISETKFERYTGFVPKKGDGIMGWWWECEPLRSKDLLSSLGSLGHPYSSDTQRSVTILQGSTVQKIWFVGWVFKHRWGCGLACKYVGKAKGGPIFSVISRVFGDFVWDFVWAGVWEPPKTPPENPHSFEPPGCKDGTLCPNCHLCRWSRYANLKVFHLWSGRSAREVSSAQVCPMAGLLPDLSDIGRHVG